MDDPPTPSLQPISMLSSYRMPAEWEPHQATWLSWPHDAAMWYGRHARVLDAYTQMVAALARSETVRINVGDAAMAAQVRARLEAAGVQGDVRLHLIPTNDTWCRDHGATFVTVASAQPGAAYGAVHLGAIDWSYNAWGGKYPCDLDVEVARHMTTALGVPRALGAMVLEGGAIETNGAGLLLTTERCLLNPNRNPHLSRGVIEQRLSALLGVERVLWLDGAGIAGDDTDGHIDNLARFVAPDTVVTVVEENRADENFVPLRANLARLQALRDQHGQPLRILTLPMPPACYEDGRRLPASYANFYIANRVVLLPCFGAPTDATARQVLEACFPDRAVVGIDCTDIIVEGGAWHCLTQQVPAVPLAQATGSTVSQ